MGEGLRYDRKNGARAEATRASRESPLGDHCAKPSGSATPRSAASSAIRGRRQWGMFPLSRQPITVVSGVPVALAT